MPSSDTNIFSPYLCITLPSLHLRKSTAIQLPGLSGVTQNIGDPQVKSKQAEGKVGASKRQITVIHHNISPENALKTIIVTHVVRIERVKQCPFCCKVTGRLLLEMGFSLLSDVRGQLCDYVPHTLTLTSHFTAEAKRLYKGSTHPLLPQAGCVLFFSSPLSFCFKRKYIYGTKSNV